MLDFDEDAPHIIYIDDTTATAPNVRQSAPINITGLRTAYVDAKVPKNNGVIETLSLTLRLFYPLDKDMDVFFIPEGTAVVAIQHRFPQKALLYKNREDYWKDLGSSIDRSSNDHFLLPSAWDFSNIPDLETDANVQLILTHDILKNPSHPRCVIHRNGMAYFFNSTILYLIYLKHICLRAQDGIYAEIAQRARLVSPIVNANVEMVFHFTVRCYILWVATATGMHLPNDAVDIASIIAYLNTLE